jgi:transposase InsO family protein
MSTRTHTNIHGGTGGGNIYYDKRFELGWKIAKEQDISREAQIRLRWFDYHLKTRNAALTCRYFGISESCFWKWKRRYEMAGLKGLEEKSRRPKIMRKPETSPEIITKIQRLRKLFPSYGKEKIHRLLNENLSVSTIGRNIRRYHMFYRARKKPRGYSWKWGQKQRIKNLKEHSKPGEHLQMDTVVLWRNSRVYYLKTAIDTVTKIAFAYAYTTNTSRTSVDFLKKLQYILPYSIKNMHTDNGGEFLGEFHQELENQAIPHYFSYPHCPKQHGCIERFNGIMRREFLEEGNLFYNLETLNKKLVNWLIEYNFHRPHSSLNYQNPLAFYDENFVSSTRKNLLPKSSSMYWTYTFC